MKYIYLVVQENVITDGAPVVAFEHLDDAEHFCETAPFDLEIRQIAFIEEVEEGAE